MDEIVEISDTEEENPKTSTSTINRSGKASTSKSDSVRHVDINQITQSSSSVLRVNEVPQLILSNSSTSPSDAQLVTLQCKKLLLPASYVTSNSLNSLKLHEIQIGNSKKVFLVNIGKQSTLPANEATKEIRTPTLVPLSAPTLTSVPPPLTAFSGQTPITLINCAPLSNSVCTSTPILPKPVKHPVLYVPSPGKTTDIPNVNSVCLRAKRQVRKIDWEGFTATDRLGFNFNEGARSMRCLRLLNMHIGIREGHLAKVMSPLTNDKTTSSTPKDDAQGNKKLEVQFKATADIEVAKVNRKSLPKAAMTTYLLPKRIRTKRKFKKCTHNIKLCDKSANFHEIKVCTAEDACCQFQCVQLPLSYEKMTYPESKNHSSTYYVGPTNLHDVDSIKKMEPSSSIYFINEHDTITDLYMDSIPSLRSKVKIIDKLVYDNYKNLRSVKKIPEKGIMQKRKRFNQFINNYHDGQFYQSKRASL
uniref:Uncharacterized protein n=1 Tax=Photinus pyralis TaxID=7054 RepID=A0A1Y1KE29_PHOPY